MEKRDLILENYAMFFCNKLVVLKPWDHLVDMHKDVVKTVPTWIHLKLDFKYWGEYCIFKIVGGIGKAIKLDQAIVKREKL